jgi:hypothetical protein
MKLPSALAAAAARPAAKPPLPHLADHPDLAAVSAKIADFQARSRSSTARAERARKTVSPTKLAKSPIERAEMLAAGGHIPSAEPGAEMRAAREEEQVLLTAICELSEQKFEIEGRLNYEASLHFQAQHVSALRRLDAALGEIFATLQELHGIDSSLRSAGYTPSCVVLPANLPRGVYAFGNPDVPQGACEAYRFRQWLRKTFGGKHA